jgi:transposase-like protein
MSSRRLTDSDKQKIVELYRQPGHTTLTLAEQYGVSNTTVSRILKTSLSTEEYESLIQQKRTARFSGGSAVQGNLLEPDAIAPDPAVEPEATAEPEAVAEPKPIPKPLITEPELKAEPEPRKVSAPVLRRSRKRSSAEEEADSPVSTHDGESSVLNVEASADSKEPTSQAAQSAAVEAIVEEDLTPQGDGMLDDDEDDEDDIDDLDAALSGEFDDDEDLEGEDLPVLPSIQLSAADFIRVLPLTEAAIPRTCYLVVDRSAELVARPLREFAELGQIPSEEIQEKTLPVFDNHRVARRFSNIRTQRVIKVPDSRVLQKAATHLQAKGITRLLIDGQVYAL